MVPALGGIVRLASVSGHAAVTPEDALILGPWMMLTGQGVGRTRDLLMTLSWAINLGVAELIIRTRKGQPRPAAATAKEPWQRLEPGSI